jgi:hypothetical protein
VLSAFFARNLKEDSFVTIKKSSKKTKATRAKPARKPSASGGAPASIEEKRLGFISDRTKTIKVRLPVAILMLKSHPAVALDALKAMANSKDATDKQFGRISRALARFGIPRFS